MGFFDQAQRYNIVTEGPLKRLSIFKFIKKILMPIMIMNPLPRGPSLRREELRKSGDFLR